MIKYLAIVFLALSLVCSDDSRAINRINQYRSRCKIAGIRKLHPDSEMKAKAEAYIEKCRTDQDGDYGILLGNGQVLANTVDGIGRKVYSAWTKNDLKEIPDHELQLISPKAYKIGCAMNEACPSQKIVCYLNKKVNRDEIETVSDVCQSCSKTFTKCEASLCDFENGNIVVNVPEDVVEVSQKDEIPTPGEIDKEGKSGQVVMSSARALVTSLGLVCISNLLFSMLAF